jgi:hypothetical protein
MASSESNKGETAGSTAVAADADAPVSSRGQSKQSISGLGPFGRQRFNSSLRLRQASTQEDDAAAASQQLEQQQTDQQQSNAGPPTLHTLCSVTECSSKQTSGELPKGLRLGSSKAAASFVAVQLKRAASTAAAAQTGSKAAALNPGAERYSRDEGLTKTLQDGQGSGKLRPAGSSGAGFAGSKPGRAAALAPVPRIADTRQVRTVSIAEQDVTRSVVDMQG